MKLLVILLIVCILRLKLVRGFPTEFSKSLPNFNTGSKVTIDPDKPLEIPEISYTQAEGILTDLGYGSSDVTTGSKIATRSGFNYPELIRSFQLDNGLPETGILDEETRLAIGSPRCGVRRAEKSAEVSKWTKSKLMYSIVNYPQGKPKETMS